MSTLTHMSAIFAIVLYAVATALLLRRPGTLGGSPGQVSTRGNKFAPSSPPHRWLGQVPFKLGLAWLGLVLHGAALIGLMITPAGIDLGFFSTATLVSLMIVLLFLLAAIDKPVDKLGVAVLPLAAMTLILRLTFPEEVHTLTNPSPGMEAHILVSILAFSLLNIAALQALLLAFQDWQLHRKRTNWFLRSLPSLQTMESLLFQMIGFGFLLLSVSLATGFLFIQDLFAQHLVHKTVLSILSWLVFGVLLAGRWRFGWRGRTAIRWTLGGFVMLTLAYFGSKLVLEIILERT
ncbi:MAG: cytochrome C assembly family protein [Methylohalobius sp. ZOD2]